MYIVVILIYIHIYIHIYVYIHLIYTYIYIYDMYLCNKLVCEIKKCKVCKVVTAAVGCTAPERESQVR